MEENTTPQEVKYLADYLGYDNGEVTLKINEQLIINAFVFLSASNPTLSNAMSYAEVLGVFADLTKQIDREREVIKRKQQEEEVKAEVTPSAEKPTTSKKTIKAEVV